MVENIQIDITLSKVEQYEQLIPQINALVASEEDLVANLANISAVLKYGFNFFWVGFYIFDGTELVINAYQGPLACSRIQVGRGVCGTAFKIKETVVVPNVDEFKGHISCSSETRSEIVIPIMVDNMPVGVFDIDSDKLNNFNATDQKYLEKIVKIIAAKW